MKDSIEICILAGGLSSRMGRDKSKLRLGGRTLLAHIRATANQLGFPVRVIRRDLVLGCGPLGGIYTALITTFAQEVLFLACDMPRVSEALLRNVLKKGGSRNGAVFTVNEGMAGFPLLLLQSALPTIQSQLAAKKFSLQKLSQTTGAALYRPNRRLTNDLINVNTPEDWKKFQKLNAKAPH